MRKILISVIIVILLALCIFSIAKGINFLGIKSIKNIKNTSSNLDDKFNEANDLSNKTYPSEVDGLEDAIKKLKIAKEDYEAKNLENAEEDSVNTVEIKTYKIHYLWTILGNYRKNRGVNTLNLDLKSTKSKDVYDLEFTLLGTYSSITDFIYDIENDEELNFEVSNFSLSSKTTSSTTGKNTTTNGTTNQEENTNTTTSTTNNTKTISLFSKKNEGINLQGKFTVQGVGITLD